MNVSLKLENVVNLNPIRLIHEFEKKISLKIRKPLTDYRAITKKTSHEYDPSTIELHV